MLFLPIINTIEIARELKIWWGGGRLYRDSEMSEGYERRFSVDIWGNFGGANDRGVSLCEMGANLWTWQSKVYGTVFVYVYGYIVVFFDIDLFIIGTMVAVKLPLLFVVGADLVKSTVIIWVVRVEFVYGRCFQWISLKNGRARCVIC